MAKTSTLEKKKALQTKLTALGVGFEETETPKQLQEKIDAHETANTETPNGKAAKEVEQVEGLDYIKSSETGGKFVMREVEGGGYRIFNPEGRKVSPVVAADSEEFKLDQQKLSRLNALEDQKRRNLPPKA